MPVSDEEPAVAIPPLLSQSLSLFGTLLVPAGTISAMLYYFGYIRERSLFSYFGVNVSLLDLTTNDYILRSSEAIFSPLAYMILLWALLVTLAQVHRALVSRGAPPWWRTYWISMTIVSLFAVALGSLGLHASSAIVGPEPSAVALGVGALAAYQCAWMAGSDPRIPTPVAEALRRTVWQRRVLVGGLVLVAAFWWTANAASKSGVTSARAIETSLETRSQAVVLSDKRLGIQGTGVSVQTLSTKASGFSFRYTGLRVLYHADGRWFLVPQGWTHTSGDLVILLPDPLTGGRVDVGP